MTIRIATLAMAVLLSNEDYGQDKKNDRSADLSTLSTTQMVDEVLRIHGFEGFFIKRFRASGDSAAVAITQAVASRNLTVIDLGELVDILEIAFSAPASIAVEEDRQPRTTLFILHDFSCRPEGSTLRMRIEEVRKKILETLQN
jgi:hypothetical protein